MTRPAFVAPQTDAFSLANIDVNAVDRDWSKGYAEEWEIALPTVTVEIVLERAPELIDARDDAKALRADPFQALDTDLRDEFQQTDGRDEWADSFQPMMDYAWPIELAYGVDVQTAVDLMGQHAGSVSLIERGAPGEETTYEIALTGGGMDMSADIAIAYLCCGCVPPLKLLQRLGEVGARERLNRFPIADVYDRAVDWIDARRGDLTHQRQLITQRDDAAA